MFAQHKRKAAREDRLSFDHHFHNPDFRDSGAKLSLSRCVVSSFSLEFPCTWCVWEWVLVLWSELNVMVASPLRLLLWRLSLSLVPGLPRRMRRWEARPDAKDRDKQSEKQKIRYFFISHRGNISSPSLPSLSRAYSLSLSTPLKRESPAAEVAEAATKRRSGVDQSGKRVFPEWSQSEWWISAKI